MTTLPNTIQPTRTRHRSLWWILVVVVVAAIALIAWVIFHKKPVPPPKPPPIPVSAVKASTQDVPVTITVIGAAQAWSSDTILVQVSGILRSVDFTEGTNVKAGQLLAQVDPAPYQAALTQEQGTLERDQALLVGANIDLARYGVLVTQD